MTRLLATLLIDEFPSRSTVILLRVEPYKAGKRPWRELREQLDDHPPHDPVH